MNATVHGNHPSTYTSYRKSSCEDFFMPNVLLWNPYVIYPNINLGLSNVSCGSAMYEGYWNDGTSDAKQPRILHGFDNIIVLVSAVYVCYNRHKMLAHDETILQLFPSSAVIPFVLLHKTGFTRELVDTCTVFSRRGINFYRLESLILERRWESYAKQLDLLTIHLSNSQSPDTCL